MKTLIAVTATFAILASACSSEAPTPIHRTNDASYHFQFNTDAGTETYWCQYEKMPANNGNPVNVTGFKWDTSDFHHWALFRTHGLDASAVDGKAFQCFGSPETKAADLTSIVSQPTTNINDLVYPYPYAIPFASEEIVMLQAHTVNPSGKSISPSLNLTVLLADEDTPVKPLGEFQFYDPYIYVPPFGDGRASMRCKVPQDIDIVYQTTHQHTRGTGMRVFLDPPNGPEASSPQLSAMGWEEPASKLGVQHISAGSSFRVFCDYRDTKGVETMQGPDKEANEMCQFYGFYSPPLAGPSAVYFEACVPDFAPGGTGDMYGTGAATCGDTLACISGCAPSDAPAIGDGKFSVGACWQKCMVSSCPTASGPFDAVFACISAKCPTECASGAADPACQTCLGANCLPEVSACQSATCSAP